MAKKKKFFTCIACGSGFTKWSGKCPECSEWNSIVETEEPVSGADSNDIKAIPLSSIEVNKINRIKTDINEFNLVCGGGIVPGSIILIGGEPGIGKSTLALQVAQNINALYISGEESPIQIRQRAERIGIDTEKVHISTNTAVEEILKLISLNKIKGRENVGSLIIDSIQTIHSFEVPGIAGSITQIRESASRLARAAKKMNLPVLFVGHITKDGSIAGPKLLEHIVDTVLYFEGDFSKDFRILRSFKNRYGSVNEIGLFRMTEKGLVEFKDKNKIFLNQFSSNASGNAVSSALEGSRTILFEVQSLVTYSSFSNPRRMADGLDLNRLILIIAVLERHGGLKLSSFDVFINVSGGFHINETAADLAIAMAITSSLKNRPTPLEMGFLGEISLSGEIRPVSQCGRRAQEFKYSGFKKLLVSKNDLDEAKRSGFSGEIAGIVNIHEAIDFLF